MASHSGSETRDSTNYREEISKMMYGFGDSSSPNPETVLLIESVVLNQQISLVQQAHQVAIERGKNKICNYELIYLMHKNKNVLKLKRLHDLQLSQDKFEKVDVPAQLEQIISEGSISCKSKDKKKRKKTHIKIMKKLGGIKEVQKMNHDYLGHLRKVRAKNATDTMPAGEYKPFQEARCISFRTNTVYKDGLLKFKKWVDPENKFKITYLGLEVMCFIAYETVADIIEAVLLTRKRKIVGHHCGFSSMQLDNGVSLRWAISVNEVNEALAMYFTPSYWLNSLFFKNMGLEYLSG